MIYPRLNRVRNGQRLSVELVNGLIKRTEYAGDLLRQGKCLAGTDISVAQRYDGATISGESVGVFAAIGQPGAIYLAPNFNITGQLISLDFNLPVPTIPTLYGKRGRFALGYAFIGNNDTQSFFAGIIYDGITPSGEKQGSGFYAQYPGTESTEFWDIDPTNNNIVVGSYYSPPDYDYNGLIYNISTGQFSTLNRPGQDSTGTYLTGIYNGIIIGGQGYGDADNFYYNGSFNSLPNGFFPYGIYENKIVGNDGLIYEIGIGFTGQIVIPELGTTFLSGIYKNYVVGQKLNFPFTSFVYNLDDDTYVTINDRCWAIG